MIVHQYFISKGTSGTTPQASLKSAVIYTRVSTKEQADSNLSLDVQLKSCQEYALKNEFTVIQSFGGTYESAKSDGRKEFNRMLEFVNGSSTKIEYILVYSFDRFSRTGANAIGILSELKENGVDVLSVTQPVDSTTAGGILQQNILLIFSHFDNQLRKEKIVAGMREGLERGYWMWHAPLGYMRDREKKLIKNPRYASKIGEAFKMLSEGYKMIEVKEYFDIRGLRQSLKKWSKMFRNPLYCGIIENKLLEKPIIGNIDPIVSQSLFIKVIEILEEKAHGHFIASNQILPLKGFVKCSSCNNPLTGYEVTKKRKYNKIDYKQRKTILYYYKCNTKGCKVNISQKIMHGEFLEYLKQFSFDPSLTPFLIAALKELINDSNKGEIENRSQLGKSLKKVNERLGSLELKFIEDKIELEFYQRYKHQFSQEKVELQQEYEASKHEISNTQNIIKKAISLCQNMANMWNTGTLSVKKRLQDLIFPEGVSFDKIKGAYRTPKINVVFTLINNISMSYVIKNKPQQPREPSLSLLVVRRGIEPLLPG